MAELRLQPESEPILAEWWESTKPKEGDQQLVREVLRTIIDGTWRGRWYWTQDLADDQPLLPVVTIQARETLMVRIRFWPAEEPPEFQLINIFDVAERLNED
ncbi:hypothetical protein ACIBF6_45195 [Streptosporangium amethystogenes]|uniref:hypothetical protein n=1 Tax=Streptosporangium amethystogenes TaxID=2002 RepID=UPI00378D2D83